MHLAQAASVDHFFEVLVSMAATGSHPSKLAPFAWACCNLCWHGKDITWDLTWAGRNWRRHNASKIGFSSSLSGLIQKGHVPEKGFGLVRIKRPSGPIVGVLTLDSSTWKQTNLSSLRKKEILFPKTKAFGLSIGALPLGAGDEVRYSIPFAYRLWGADVERLLGALKELLCHQEVLRTVLKQSTGGRSNAKHGGVARHFGYFECWFGFGMLCSRKSAVNSNQLATPAWKHQRYAEVSCGAVSHHQTQN